MGFGPGRSAHDAVLKAREYVACGKRWVVDMDLGKLETSLRGEMGKMALRTDLEKPIPSPGRIGNRPEAGSGTESGTMADEAAKRGWPRQRNAAGARTEESGGAGLTRGRNCGIKGPG